MYTGNRRLNVFYTVANTNSFTRAAKILHMTQPAVSSQIQRFEEYYGMRLFHRNHDGVVLTDTGRMAYSYAERVVRLLNELDYKLRRIDDDNRHLRLGATSDTIIFFVKAFLNGFITNNPNVKVRMNIYDDEKIFFKLGDQSIDLAVTMKIKNNRNISVERSWQIPLSVIIPRDHPLEKRECITVDQLLGYPIVCRGSAEDAFSIIASHVEENFNRNALDIIDNLGSLETVTAAVQAGMGIGIIPEIEGKGLQQNPELTVRRIDPPIMLGYHLIRDTRYSRHESVHALLKHVDCNFTA
ncbi:LysR family transcriptional regulator [Microbulbifer rhizosphaerae]|uniref:DNA-binding transcriptional LysR family regulator n=1 Tax=Microbulbifer rhizosphaerae TaxID=1562603 RepID=A0A7W4W9F5_9GAMM|nr:LysR family transcriptional regulator [Microbulbifer rhizosphaerae]MBB3060140.1 DNA-binding transcriptional LysR family regulator [Microbulbifer rhizosphaerae]